MLFQPLIKVIDKFLNYLLQLLRQQVEAEKLVVLSYHSLWVANSFLRFAYNEKRVITHLKLQKLIYYAHGWCLALLEKPLIDEPVQAWDYGPVIESIYHAFKEYGSLGIFPTGIDVDDNIKEIFFPEIPKKDQQTRLLLEKIWQVYGGYSALQLSTMTHAEGSPWQITRQQYGKKVRSVEISNDLIKEHFTNLAKAKSKD